MATKTKRSTTRPGTKTKAAKTAGATTRKQATKTGGRTSKEQTWTKEELYKKAKKAGIEGRSKMNKQQLSKALNKK